MTGELIHTTLKERIQCFQTYCCHLKAHPLLKSEVGQVALFSAMFSLLCNITNKDH